MSELVIPNISVANTSRFPTGVAPSLVRDCDRGRGMAYGGTLEQVIDELSQAAEVSNGVDHAMRGAHFWHPGLLVRGLLASGVSGWDKVRLVNNTTQLTLEAYGGTLNKETLGNIATHVGRLGLGHTPVWRADDPKSVSATTSQLSLDTAKRIRQQTKRPIFGIPLMNGGLVPGGEALLQHRGLGGEAIAYPIRFSRDKRADGAPLVSPEERIFMQRTAGNRDIVILDEDAWSGDTMTEAVSYFAKMFPHNRVYGFVNLDDNPDRDKRQCWAREDGTRGSAIYRVASWIRGVVFGGSK